MAENETVENGSNPETEVEMLSAASNIIKTKDEQIKKLSDNLADTSAKLALAENKITDLETEVKKHRIIQDVNAGIIAEKEVVESNMGTEADILRAYNLENKIGE